MHHCLLFIQYICTPILEICEQRKRKQEYGQVLHTERDYSYISQFKALK